MNQPPKTAHVPSEAKQREQVHLMDVVLASHNPGKLAELQALLTVKDGLAGGAGAGAETTLRLRLLAAPTLALSEPQEPYQSFLENALHKARHVCRASGLPAIADDSGLMVAALKGAPGVHSAYAARHYGAAEVATEAAANEVATTPRALADRANNAWLLGALAASTAYATDAAKPASDADDETQRAAAFVCVLVALRHVDDPLPLVALGALPGVIAHAAAGAHGFGYDPLFLPRHPAAHYGAEVSLGHYEPEHKHAISHRAAAARQLRQLLRQHWGL